GAQRRNSLTGEEGEPARVSNWPLYYLFCLGTELGRWQVRTCRPRTPAPHVKVFGSFDKVAECVWSCFCIFQSVPFILELVFFFNFFFFLPQYWRSNSGPCAFEAALLSPQYPLLYGLVLIPCWSSLVCLSRIYMGMHSLLDIIAGFLYTILILAVFYPFVDLIDNFNQTHKYAPLIIIGLHLALGIFSFTLDTWSTSQGDIAQILGSGAGIACGSHVTHSMALILDPSPDILPLRTPPITLTVFAKAILRVLIGMGVVLIVRNIMKKITIPLACKIFKIPCDDIRKARQHMEVELPYRYITYGMVGFSITFLVPYIFLFIGIS
ncbi:Sphingosine-1-phosphate phosphatase 1, partial [Heterocephalus glaber]